MSKHVRLLLVIIVAGAIVFSPGIRSPLWLDDHLQVAMVEGTYPAPRGPADLYDFVGDADRRAMMDRGVLPWWTHPRFKLRFFRPLSSALLHAEHRVFHHSPLPLHLGSFAWWIAAVVAARALYRRVISERAATVATAFFALAPCHALPLAWVAHREVLMSLAFGTLALSSLVRTRDRPSPARYALTTLLFTLSVTSGEYGICFAGYVIAFELTREGSLTKKVAGLATFAAPATAYLAVHVLLGYGAAGSGFYHDPLGSPGVFLAAAPRRLFTLIADAWLAGNADLWRAEAPAVVVGLVAAIALLVLWRPIRAAARAQGPSGRRDLSWLAWGSLLALVPVLASAPSSRLIAVSVLGVAPIVAVLVDHAWFSGGAEDAPRDKHLRLAGALMGLLHFVQGPVVSWLGSAVLQGAMVSAEASAAWIRHHTPDTARANLVVVSAAAQAVGPFAVDPVAPPARWHVLVTALHALAVRVDERTLDLVLPKGRADWSDFFRSDSAPIRTGDRVELAGLEVTVLDAGENGPVRVRFVFDRNLDDPSLTWVTQAQFALKDSPPPKQGAGVQVGF